jgi:hypothetical protein
VLRKLAELCDQDILTDEEFAAHKAKLLQVGAGAEEHGNRPSTARALCSVKKLNRRTCAVQRW